MQKEEANSDLYDLGFEHGVREGASEFYMMLKNPITLDAILSAKDKFQLTAIFRKVAKEVKSEVAFQGKNENEP